MANFVTKWLRQDNYQTIQNWTLICFTIFSSMKPWFLKQVSNATIPSLNWTEFQECILWKLGVAYKVCRLLQGLLCSSNTTERWPTMPSSFIAWQLICGGVPHANQCCFQCRKTTQPTIYLSRKNYEYHEGVGHCQRKWLLNVLVEHWPRTNYSR